jgi:restriction endonuclease Mrr
MVASAPSHAWHYPAELLELVVDAVGRLNRGKGSVLDFFRGAGVPERYLTDIAVRVAADRNAVNKFEMARTILTRLNGAGDSMIGPRREILNRIVKTESFEHCWPNDQLAARGAVAAIRKVIHERDAFTRMEAEKNRERADRLREKQAEIDRQNTAREKRKQIRADLGRLFSETDPWKRGKQLEGILNRLFALDGIGVRDAFHLTGDEAEGIVEQIDGVVELDGSLYLVETKWLTEKVSPNELGVHFSRVFLRHAANGIFISASGFTEPAIAQSKLALTKMTSILCELEELVRLLEHPNGNVGDYFREKVRAAVTERRPLHRPVIA